MLSSTDEFDFPSPVDVAVDEHTLRVTLEDGRDIGVPIAWYPRLLSGTAEQRAQWTLSPLGIHWDALDEDISVKMIVCGLKAYEYGRPKAA